jgi:hypothetical protein
MAWVEYYGTLINLQYVSRIDIDYKKIIFWFDKEHKVEIAFNSEEIAEKVYEFIISILGTREIIISLTKVSEKLEKQSEQNK